MKTLKYIGFALLSLVILFVAFAYLQDRNVSVSRSVVVAAPISVVFDQFNDLEKRVKWSPWEAQDSTMETTLGPVTKGVGASYSWVSKDQGDGSITYTEVVENQLIESQLRFGAPDADPSQGIMIFTPVKDGVKVTWEVHMDMGNNPLTRFLGPFLDDMVGEMFENGLATMKENSLKEALEGVAEMIANYEDVDINMIDVEARPCISLMDSCSMDEMTEKIGIDFGQIGAYLGAHNLQHDGFSRIIFHAYNPPTKIVFEPLFITTEAVEINDSELIAGMTYGGKTITATHLGSYESSAHVWEALDVYLEKNGLEMNGSPWEQYENTIMDVSDPSELITHIFMPVK